MVTASLFISNHAAYPTPHRTDQNSVQRTLRRKELAQKVCGVPYAAKNWPKKCAAYPTPHRTDRKSVRRTLRRIELAQKVCGVPYAAKNWPKKCAAYPTPHRTGPKSVQRTLRRIELAQKVCGVGYAAHLCSCGNFGAITPPALRILRLMVCLPRSGCTFFHCALTIPQTIGGRNASRTPTPLLL